MLQILLKTTELDSELRNCGDCRHCQAAVSWWCRNKEAIERRGTAIPGTSNCPQWQPAKKWSELSRQERFWFFLNPLMGRWFVT